MLRMILMLFIVSALCPGVHAGQLLINEFVTDTTDDWVELFFAADQREQRDIAGLFVTGYYGTNEPLAADPITIYSHDRPETPWDDRLVVVHLTRPGIPDETDLTGDTNRNGVLDVYCNNYSGGLWSTDGVVAIDRDDNPSNGGMVDFVFYSNRDGKLHPAVATALLGACDADHWRHDETPDRELWGVSLSSEGLMAGQSLCRQTAADSNSAADFILSPLPTPGRPNIGFIPYQGRRLFKSLRREITVLPRSMTWGRGEIPLFVFFPCTLRMRIFSTTGVMIYESPEQPLSPGFAVIPWNPSFRQGLTPTGLYLCKLEAANRMLHLRQEHILPLIVSRYR